MYWLRSRNTRLVVLGLVAACGVCLVLTTGMTMADEKEGKQVTLTDKNNNTKQKLSKGDLLVLHLETQPGTGFSWGIAKRDKDQLTLLSKVLLENPNMLPGGKTVQLYTFRATTVGTR
jgi:predicted secreted protein